jgi:hypothetical protein
MKKRKIQVGDSKKINNIHYVVEELFVADSVRWVRATTHRKKYNVTFYGKKFSYYDTDNKYLTEGEWLRVV